MKFGLAGALALALACSQVVAAPAYAEQTSFRTAAPQTFSTEDLQQYGLSSADAAAVQGLQQQGYQVVVLTPEQAAQMNGGWSTNTWLIVGLIVVVIAVAAAS